MRMALVIGGLVAAGGPAVSQTPWNPTAGGVRLVRGTIPAVSDRDRVPSRSGVAAVPAPLYPPAFPAYVNPPIDSGRYIPHSLPGFGAMYAGYPGVYTSGYSRGW